MKNFEKNSSCPPSVEEIYDECAQDYNGEFAPITFYLKKYIPPEKSIKIADIGGGDGYWDEKLIELGYYNFIITDLSKNMLKEAKKRLNKLKTINEKLNFQYIKADIREMSNIKSNSFDFVISLFDPVSYSLKPLKATKELVRITKTEAIIIVSLDTKYRRVSELIEAK